MSMQSRQIDCKLLEDLFEDSLSRAERDKALYNRVETFADFGTDKVCGNEVLSDDAYHKIDFEVCQDSFLLFQDAKQRENKFDDVAKCGLTSPEPD